MTTRHFLPAILLGLLPLAVQAGAAEDDMLQRLEAAHPGTKFSSIQPTPVVDVFEVWMGQNVAYVSKHAPRYFIFGRLFDTVAMQDLTAAKLPSFPARAQPQALAAAEGPINVTKLPTADAIRAGDGGIRSLIVFSDPACPYCRRLETELAQVKDVVINTYVVAYLGADLPQAILCARQPEKAWTAWMRDSVRPAAAQSSRAGCVERLQRNTSLAQQLGVTGTPTIVFADGSRLPGYATAAEINSRLSALSATKESRK